MGLFLKNDKNDCVYYGVHKMNDVHKKWMLLALEEAKKAQAEDEVPIGAVLVCKEQIIGRGKNAREKSGRTIAHAEIEALLDYNAQTKQWRLPPDTSLYVTLEPCMMCTGAYVSARVSHIYFGCKDTKDAGLMRVKPWILQNVFDHIPTEITGGVLESECSSLLSAYFKAKREPKKE